MTVLRDVKVNAGCNVSNQNQLFKGGKVRRKLWGTLSSLPKKGDLSLKSHMAYLGILTTKNS